MRALVDKSTYYEIDLIVAWFVFLFLVHMINFPKNLQSNQKYLPMALEF